MYQEYIDDVIEQMDKDKTGINIYRNNYLALELLLVNSKWTQKKIRSDYRELQEGGYLKEFCTIRMTGPRRSGHSHNIIELAMKHFDNAVFISPTKDISDRLFDLMRCYYCYCNSDGIKNQNKKRGTIKMTSGSLYRFINIFQKYKLKNIETEAIFVDGFVVMENNFKEKIDDIYNIGSVCMANNPYKFFIFVG